MDRPPDHRATPQVPAQHGADSQGISGADAKGTDMRLFNLPQPDVQPVPGKKRLYRLMTDYLVQLPYSGRWLLIKAGFLFDGASIPRWLWSIIGSPFDPNWLAAALIHDALYAAELMTRHACDKELFHAMRATSQIGYDNARKFFIAVDLFGSWPWRKHTLKSIDDARTECFLYDDTKPIIQEGT